MKSVLLLSRATPNCSIVELLDLLGLELRHVLEGKKVRGRFVLGEGDVIQEKEVGVVDVL